MVSVLVVSVVSVFVVSVVSVLVVSVVVSVVVSFGGSGVTGSFGVSGVTGSFGVSGFAGSLGVSVVVPVVVVVSFVGHTSYFPPPSHTLISFQGSASNVPPFRLPSTKYPIKYRLLLVCPNLSDFIVTCS